VPAEIWARHSDAYSEQRERLRPLQQDPAEMHLLSAEPT
jgi:hypothetical protein